MYLKKQVVNGWVELTDTRSGKVVARVPTDRRKAESTVGRYVQAVEARSRQLASQQALESKVLPNVWASPVSY